jgi:multiple sugar transport system permease protein
MKKKNSVNPAAVVCMALLSVCMFIPFLIMFSTSLKSMAEIFSRGGFIRFFIPKEVHWENYVTAFTTVGNWSLYFYNTIYITVFTVGISLCINSLAGYAFARLNFPFRNQLFFAGLVGMMIPAQATMIPVFFLLKNFPLAGGNNILGQGGMGLLNTPFALMGPYLAGAFGVFLFRQFFLNFPQSLDDAAKIVGISRIGAFLRIYVPLSKPVFASLMVMKATQCWNEYTWPLIVTRSERMRTLQLALVLFRDEVGTKWNLLLAATMVIILPLVVLFFLAQRSFVEGIVTTGLKG